MQKWASTLERLFGLHSLIQMWGSSLFEEAIFMYVKYPPNTQWKFLQVLYVLWVSTSSAICGTNFSKQNTIKKSCSPPCLKFDTLDALIWVSQCDRIGKLWIKAYYGLPSVAQHEKFRTFLLWFCWILSFVISELIKYLISWPCLTKARILCLDSLHSIIA